MFVFCAKILVFSKCQYPYCKRKVLRYTNKFLQCLLDQMVLKQQKTRPLVLIHVECQCNGLEMPWRQCYLKVCGQVVLSVDWVILEAELDGPVMRTVLSVDQVVLEAGFNGPVMKTGWSCIDLFPMGNFVCSCEGIFLAGSGICLTLFLVGWTSWRVGMSMPVPAVSDSICWHDESALTSAGEPSVSSKSSGD